MYYIFSLYNIIILYRFLLYCNTFLLSIFFIKLFIFINAYLTSIDTVIYNLNSLLYNSSIIGNKYYSSSFNLSIFLILFFLCIVTTPNLSTLYTQRTQCTHNFIILFPIMCLCYYLLLKIKTLIWHLEPY